MNRQADKIFIDVRGLEPCEPMERALEAADQLGASEYLHMVHVRDPRLLYPVLEKRGYLWRTLTSEDNDFHIYIWRDGDHEAETKIPQPKKD